MPLNGRQGMSLKREMIGMTEDALRGLLALDLGTIDDPSVDVVAFGAIGDAARLNLELPPCLRGWVEAMPVERLDRAARAAMVDLASLSLPVDHRLVAEDGDGWAVAMRDRIDSSRIGMRLALVGCWRKKGWCEVEGLGELDAALAAFDQALRKVATVAEAARAMGARAGMISSGCWLFTACLR